MVIWLIGLSGSGKTTIGREVYKKWKAQDASTVLVDGDEIREIFRHNQGSEPYSVEGRRQNAERISRLCAWLDAQDINVVCCILSIFEETRQWNRTNYKGYYEVFVDAPRELLKQRRDLYDKAESGQMEYVVGVDIPFEPPVRPDMVVHTGPGADSPDCIAEQILNRALQVEHRQ